MRKKNLLHKFNTLKLKFINNPLKTLYKSIEKLVRYRKERNKQKYR